MPQIFPDTAISSPENGLSKRTFWVLIAIAAVVAILPLLFTDYPPFTDYLNHLGRIAVVSQDEGGGLRRYWGVDGRVLSNLGTDLLMIGLAKIVSIPLAGKITAMLIVVAVGTGFARLHAELHERRTALALLGFGLVYTAPLLYGFLNYTFGIALLLHLCAGDLALARRSARVRTAHLVVGFLALAITHLMALSLAIIFLALLRWVRRERLASIAMPVLVGGAAFLAIFFGSPSGNEATGATWRAFGDKLSGIYTFTAVGAFKLDMLFLLTLILIVPVALVSGLGAVRWRNLAAFGVMAAIWLASPSSMKTVNSVDFRLVLPLFLFLFLALDAGRRKASGVITGLVFAVLLYRSASLVPRFRHADEEYARIDRALAAIPPDAVVLSVYNHDDHKWDPFLWDPVLVYGAHLAVLRGHFVSHAFTNYGQQSLFVQPQWRPLLAYPDGDDAALRRIRATVPTLRKGPLGRAPIYIFRVQIAGTPRMMPKLTPVAKGTGWELGLLQ